MNPANTEEPIREQLRDVSLETVAHVRAMNLSLFLDRKVHLSEAESEEQVLALIWLLHEKNDQDMIAERVADGTAMAAVRAFRRDPAALWALPEVTPAVRKVKHILGRNHFLEAAEAEAAADDGQGADR